MGKEEGQSSIGGLKGRVKNLSPLWFGAVMGFGKVSILVYRWPYPFSGVETIAIVVWLMNVAIFLLLLVLSIIRYILWPRAFLDAIKHPVQACLLWRLPRETANLFSSSFSIGLSTIVIMLSYVSVPKWGEPMVIFSEALFWINAAIALLTCFGIFALMLTSHMNISIFSISGVFVLPALAIILIAATGSAICSVVPANSPTLYRTLIGSYVFWGMGFPLANVVVVLCFLRLLLHKWPARADIFTILLPIGPLGQGAFAIMELGLETAKSGLISTENGDNWASITLFVGLMIWGWALVWVIFAIMGIGLQLVKTRVGFDLSWWTLVFPLGTFAVASGILGDRFNDNFFKVFASICTVLVVIFWLWVSFKCVQHTIDGRLFFEKIGARREMTGTNKGPTAAEREVKCSDNETLYKSRNNSGTDGVSAGQPRPGDVMD